MLKQVKAGVPDDVGFRLNPVDAYYHLDVEGVRVGTFYSLTGGDIEVTVIEHDVVFSTGEASTLLIPGPVRFSPITLSRGFGNSAELYNWFALAASGNIVQARKNGTITLNGFVNGEYKPIVRWNLTNAWPSKISGFQSNQFSGASVAKLSITIVTEMIEREDGDL